MGPYFQQPPKKINQKAQGKKKLAEGGAICTPRPRHLVVKSMHVSCSLPDVARAGNWHLQNGVARPSTGGPRCTEALSLPSPLSISLFHFLKSMHISYVRPGFLLPHACCSQCGSLAPATRRRPPKLRRSTLC